MENYDDIIGFDYLDFNEWKKNIEQKIVPIAKNTLILLGVRNTLRDRLRDNFKNEIETNQNIKVIIFGGTNQKGNYLENSLAEIYKELLGINIDLNEWVVYLRKGIDPMEQGVKPKFENNYFIYFLRKIKRITSKILSKVQIQTPNIEELVKEIIKNPEKILESIENLYNSIIDFYFNNQTFFILNTRCCPQFYLERAYPKLKDNLEQIVKIFDLEVLFVPPFEIEELKQNYSIWGHKEGGLASKIINLINSLEIMFNFSSSGFYDEKTNEYYEIESFKKNLELVIKNPINLFEEFKNQVKKKNLLPYKLKFYREEIRISGYNKSLQLIIEKDIIIRITNGYSPNTRYAFYCTQADFKLLLIEFIDKVSSYLFLGLATLYVVENLNYPQLIPAGSKRYLFLEFRNYWS